MASSSKRKTTAAKLTRERALLERRQLKQARKAARRLEAATSPAHRQEPPTGPDSGAETRDDGADGP